MRIARILNREKACELSMRQNNLGPGGSRVPKRHAGVLPCVYIAYYYAVRLNYLCSWIVNLEHVIRLNDFNSIK